MEGLEASDLRELVVGQTEVSQLDQALQTSSHL